MANYHTMTMLCHELGHHLAERYEVERSELNCKEYQADLACVLLEMSLSQGKKGARRIRRYQDLLVSLNNEIPDHYTNTTVDLKANCEAMDVKFPSTPELMSLYASAFCERRRLLHADPGYGSPADLVNDLYLKEQNELLKKFPPVLSYDNELLHEHLHLHEIDFTSRFRRGIKEMEIWGTPMIYRLNGFFLDSSCSPRFYNMVFPEAVPKGAMIEVKVRDWDGVLTDRRQYYAEEDLNISDIRTSSMITYGDWGMALLQVETGSDGEELILYTDSDGLEMERKVVPIDVYEADFRLIGQKSGYVQVAERILNSEGFVQIMTFEINLRDPKRSPLSMKVILDVDIEMNRSDWQICRAGETYVLSLGGNLFEFPGEDPKKMMYMTGTGLMGNKEYKSHPGLSEFYVPQALGYDKVHLYMVDRRRGSSIMDDRVFYRRFFTR